MCELFGQSLSIHISNISKISTKVYLLTLVIYQKGIANPHMYTLPLHKSTIRKLDISADNNR